MLFTYFGSQALVGLAANEAEILLKRRILERALLQEGAFLDSQGSTYFTQRLGRDALVIREGLGSLLSQFVMNLAAFLGDMILALAFSWELTLVLLTMAPVFAAASLLMIRLSSNLEEARSAQLSPAISFTREVFENIRTVYSFVVEKTMLQTFLTQIQPLEHFSWRKVAVSICYSLSFLTMFATYSLATYYGVKMLVDMRISNQSNLTNYFLVFDGTVAMSRGKFDQFQMSRI